MAPTVGPSLRDTCLQGGTAQVLPGLSRKVGTLGEVGLLGPILGAILFLLPALRAALVVEVVAVRSVRRFLSEEAWKEAARSCS